jgi:hypothetical protein
VPGLATHRSPILLAAGVGLVLSFNMLWYGVYLSFPMIGEDGAHSYSSLVEAVRSGTPLRPVFPIKWLEGLGQINSITTVTFDPFSWLMYTGLPSGDALRISYALRATVCWLSAYVLVIGLFPGARRLAASAASLCMLLSFTLTAYRAIPTHASVTLASQLAVFPAICWFYVYVARESRWIGWRDVAFALALLFFLLLAPIWSLAGLVALSAFAVGLLLGRLVHRAKAALALGKLAVFGAVILFAPEIGLYHAWSAIASISTRYVFVDELTTYAREYLPPNLWDHAPIGLRTVVLLALSLVLLRSRWPRALQTVMVTLVIVVCETQVGKIARAYGVASAILERLPRPFYIEHYLPVFYSVAAAYALFRWRALVAPRHGTGMLWLLRLGVFGAASWVIFGRRSALGLVALVLAASGALRSRPGLMRRVDARQCVPTLAIVALYLGALATWQIWPGLTSGIYPLFFAELQCRSRYLWCKDPPGRTMGAGTNPITDFLREHLDDNSVFRGRADFLLVPAPRIVLPFDETKTITPQEFQRLREWYARAYDNFRSLMPDRGMRSAPGLFYHRPAHFDKPRRQYSELIKLLGDLASNPEPTTGRLPDDVIAEIVNWAHQHPNFARPLRFMPAWQLPEVTVMMQARNLNFLVTGNGMQLRALPLVGVPIASSYENALDFLYYLFWTRYVNEGIPAHRSINFTSLEALHPERLGLIGVRYVVARDMVLGEAPKLPRVFAWKGYSVYEIADVNTGAYSPLEVRFAPSLTAELGIMRDRAFHPVRMAVLGESERGWFKGGPPLATLRSSRISLEHQVLTYEATSTGRTVAVLPFKFSHCWYPTWSGTPGRITRADAALLAVVFEGRTMVRLTWSAGYGPLAACLRADAALVPQALSAGAQFP